jgi:3-hydroxybutyryl-CoA dehydrogenase
LPAGPIALLVADPVETRALEPLLQAARLSVVRRSIDTREFDLEEYLLDLEETLTGLNAQLTTVVVAADRLVDARLDIILLIDEMLRPDRPLLVSCTQAGVAEQAALCRHPHRVVGYSLIGLLGGMRAAEVAASMRTDPALARRTAALFAQAGVEARQVTDAPGLVLARVLAPIVNEAALAAGEGIAPPEAIDAATRLGGMPFGPLRWADDVGLDRIVMILEYLARSIDSERYRPAPLLQQLALAGYTGTSVGRGFFTYDRRPEEPGAGKTRIRRARPQ